MVDGGIVRRVGATSIAALALSACAQNVPAARDNAQAEAAVSVARREARSPMKLLTYATQANAVHQAIGMQGILSLDKGCLMLRTDARRYLLFFPRGMVDLDPSGQAIRQDGIGIPVGTRIALDGAGYRNTGNLAMLDDPGSCDADYVFVVFPGQIRRV